MCSVNRRHLFAEIEQLQGQSIECRRLRHPSSKGYRMPDYGQEHYIIYNTTDNRCWLPHTPSLSNTSCRTTHQLIEIQPCLLLYPYTLSIELYITDNTQLSKRTPQARIHP